MQCRRGRSEVSMRRLHLYTRDPDHCLMAVAWPRPHRRTESLQSPSQRVQSGDGAGLFPQQINYNTTFQKL